MNFLACRISRIFLVSLQLIKTKINRQRAKITNKFVSRLDDLFDVAYLEVIKLLDVQQQFLLSQGEKGREGCLNRMINVNFIKQSPSVAKIIEGRRGRVQTAQEESDDDMRTDTSYKPDEGSDT